MHTIFRIDEINQTNNRFWNVKLTMTNDNDEQLKCLTEYIRNEIGGGTEYHRLDWLMIQLYEFDKAEKISNNDSKAYAQICNQLGTIYENKGDRIKTVQYYEQAIEFYQKTIFNLLF
ncbi:unnamed protein product [Rotaria sp. Silwood1]|nr:unnamed protein product [Rotaria sp. Silwood1]CAF3702379.1 unnamed protein product [Rotaria sp. Silwood1]CAF3773608.1 unnamed protein product [Rotaria sp. Silwood1]CAF4806834.1 unnamed protein product [Rotaria sp. Silwood1]CAF4895115.1 unnamed protein product [Rotaria sp. Silwood1]